MSEMWSIELRSAADQAAFDRLKAVLAETLGLDWKTNIGAPDGWEVAEDCAEALWAAGFRLKRDPRATTVRPDCTWPRCRRSPNSCFAWCKCVCHNHARMPEPPTPTRMEDQR